MKIIGNDMTWHFWFVVYFRYFFVVLNLQNCILRPWSKTWPKIWSKIWGRGGGTFLSSPIYVFPRKTKTNQRKPIRKLEIEILTAGFLIHGRHGRIFGQIFGQVFDQGFWPGFFGQKIQCTGLPGQRNTVLQFDRDRTIQFKLSQFYWDREKVKKNRVLKIPYW